MKKYILLAIIAGALLACTKDKDFIDDNSNPTGVGSRPVSTNTLYEVAVAGNPALNNRSYAAGATATTEIQYFSASPVQEINLYSTISSVRSLVQTIPYAPAFSAFKAADTLLVKYVVPALATGTTIKLDYEIKNQNALTLTKTATIKVL